HTSFSRDWSSDVCSSDLDELSRANRSRALAGGFVVTILTAVVVFVASFFREISAPEAIHAIVTLGLAGTLLRFASLEMKAHRDRSEERRVGEGCRTRAAR